MPLRITCVHLGRTVSLPRSSQGRLLWVRRFLALRCHFAPGTDDRGCGGNTALLPSMLLVGCMITGSPPSPSSRRPLLRLPTHYPPPPSALLRFLYDQERQSVAHTACSAGGVCVTMSMTAMQLPRLRLTLQQGWQQQLLQRLMQQMLPVSAITLPGVHGLT